MMSVVSLETEIIQSVEPSSQANLPRPLEPNFLPLASLNVQRLLVVLPNLKRTTLEATVTKLPLLYWHSWTLNEPLSKP